MHKGLLLPHRTTRTLQAEQSETHRPHSWKHLMDVCSEQTKQRVKNEHEMTTEWQFPLHLLCFSSPPSSGCCLLSSWGPLIWIPIILLLPRLQQHLQTPGGVNSLSAGLLLLPRSDRSCCLSSHLNCLYNYHLTSCWWGPETLITTLPVISFFLMNGSNYSWMNGGLGSCTPLFWTSSSPSYVRRHCVNTCNICLYFWFVPI